VLTNSPLWTIADAYRRLPAGRQAFVYRIGLMVVVGLAAFILVELAWQLVVSGGHCVGCLDEDPAAIAGATGAGSAAAAGSQKDPWGKKAFGRWWDNLFDPAAPPRTVEPLTPEDKEQGRQAFELIKYGVGSKGFIEGKEGSKGHLFNQAADDVANFRDVIDEATRRPEDDPDR